LVPGELGKLEVHEVEDAFVDRGEYVVRLQVQVPDPGVVENCELPGEESQELTAAPFVASKPV
jgi:hypothetical protein